MVTRVSPEKMANIRPLFDEWDKTMIWSCLQGHMGRAWADDADAPSAAQIVIGDLSFFAGHKNRELVCNIPENYARPSILMISKDTSWHGLIEDVYKHQFTRCTRYAFRYEPDVFDKNLLRSYVDALPAEYRIIPIDDKLYHSTGEEEWSRDFCSQFPSYEAYRTHGVGYVALLGEKTVCGASSYTYYDGGIEIQIDTLESHRRKGLAAACAGSLILACLEKGLYPAWDAANRESAALAEKLGYHPDGEYITYEICCLLSIPH